MSSKKSTLLEWMNRTPPWMCRMMAICYDSTRPIGDRMRKKTQVELATQSGLPRRTVVRLSYLKTWDGVDVDVASKFIMACGVDILSKKPTQRIAEKNLSKDVVLFFSKTQRKAFDQAASAA